MMIPITLPAQQPVPHVIVVPVRNYQHNDQLFASKLTTPFHPQKIRSCYFRTNAWQSACDVSLLPQNESYAVMGYADPRGTTASNQQLSLHRAVTIANQLLKENIKICHIAGKGEIGSHITLMSYAFDRRVDIVSALC